METTCSPDPAPEDLQPHPRRAARQPSVAVPGHEEERYERRLPSQGPVARIFLPENVLERVKEASHRAALGDRERFGFENSDLHQEARAQRLGGRRPGGRPQRPTRPGLTEPRVVHRTLEILVDLGWIRAESARAVDGGRPTVRFHINPTGRRARNDEPARRRTAKTAKTGIPPS